MLVLLFACTAPKDDTGGAPTVELPTDCSPLPTQAGTPVSDVAGLQAALADGASVILLEDGTYDLTAGDAESSLVVPAGTTLRSASGDASAVVLEAGFATADPVGLGAGSTLAELTVAHAGTEGVRIAGAAGARVFGVVIEDPGETGIAVGPDGGYSDDVEIACSQVRFTDECAVGIDVAQAQGTHLRDLVIDTCEQPSLRLASGSRGSVVERVIAESLALGDTEYVGDERIYDASECDGVTVGHYGGEVRNVLLTGSLVLREACGTALTHVTVAGDLFWASSQDLTITNALANVVDSGGATITGALTPTAADFVSATDLHLAAGSAAIDAGVATDVGDDVDGEARDAAPDVGGDEFGG